MPAPLCLLASASARARFFLCRAIKGGGFVLGVSLPVGLSLSLSVRLSYGAGALDLILEGYSCTMSLWLKG